MNLLDNIKKGERLCNGKKVFVLKHGERRINTNLGGVLLSEKMYRLCEKSVRKEMVEEHLKSMVWNDQTIIQAVSLLKKYKLRSLLHLVPFNFREKHEEKNALKLVMLNTDPDIEIDFFDGGETETFRIAIVTFLNKRSQQYGSCEFSLDSGCFYKRDYDFKEVEKVIMGSTCNYMKTFFKKCIV